MRTLGLVIVLGLSCLAGYRVGTRRLGLSRAGLRAVGAAALEAIGLGAAFFAVNLTLAVLPLVLLRVSTGLFVSVYWADHATIAAVSILQGVAFRWWRDRG